jgi:uncharacterized protein (TIGR04222 family)
MEWLDHNFIADMYGPSFLLFYGVFIAVVWIACARRSTSIERSAEPLPMLPAKPDPYELAWLRDGERGVTQLAAFRLVQEGLLIPAEQGKSALMRNPEAPQSQELNQIERLLLNEAFVSPRESSKVLREFAPRIASLCSEYERKALAAELLASPEQAALRSRLSFLGSASILALGGYKLLIAISRGKQNVVFLIVFAAIGVVVTRLLCRKRRLNARGKEYLKRVSSSLEFMKGRLEEDPSMAPLVVGVFGLAVLYGTTWGEAMALRPGDYGASSDSMSSDSGGGDSGGDSGGGDGGGSGCGGCGGGGGD